jgi:hypothetical protein
LRPIEARIGLEELARYVNGASHREDRLQAARQCALVEHRQGVG